SDRDRYLLKVFGEYMGIGFQLKDDLLDVYADQEKFGKQVGGDIIANKKTFLLIKALELAEGEEKQQLSYWLAQTQCDAECKLAAIKAAYEQLQIRTLTEAKMTYYIDAGCEGIKNMEISEEMKNIRSRFWEQIINREK